MKAIFLASVLSFALSAQAGIFSGKPGSKNVEGVTLNTTGSVSVDGGEFVVDAVGAGLRQKKVLFANVRVYVAEVLASEAGAFVRKESEALTSIDKSSTVVVKLTFLRTVDAPTVQQSFVDALEANGFGPKSDATLKALLTAVEKGGEAVNGKALVFVTHKYADGTESLTYEDAAGKVTTVKGAAGVGKKLLSMWLGKSADAGLEVLKSQIVKGN